MKRYSHFLRSGATISFLVLYVVTTFFSFSLVSAEENTYIEQPIISSEVVVETTVAEEEIVVQESTAQEVENTPEAVEVVEAVVEQTFVSETSEETIAVVCTQENSPVITFEETYADSGPGGAETLLLILSQIGAEATDAEDGVVPVTNNLIDFFPFNSGWHDVSFEAVDSDGCVTSETVSVFIFGDSYTPVCSSGDIYVKMVLPDNLTTVLGTNSIIESEQWFPVLYNGGLGLSESENEITAPHDISITRVGTTLFVNVAPGVSDGDIVAQAIIDSIQVSGGTVSSANVFSGNVAVIDLTATECPELCGPNSGPIVTSYTEIVTIEENTVLSSEEILALFQVVASDQDGEGLVSMSSDLASVNFQTAGTYSITLTITDNEGCELLQTLTLVVEGGEDEEDDNGGGGGSGCVNPNGCGGGSTNDEEPEGEILGASTCTPYLTTFMQMGEANLKEDVIRLQIFLNEYMSEDLVVDGIYGPETFEAVKRFQAQEFDEILKPWGITEPTGIARETTTRHINNIMCPELNIAMPILYCATTGNLIYPDGTIVDPDPEYILYNGKPVIKTWVITPTSEVQGVTDYRYEK